MREIGTMKVRRGWEIWGEGDAFPMCSWKGERSVRGWEKGSMVL